MAEGKVKSCYSGYVLNGLSTIAIKNCSLDLMDACMVSKLNIIVFLLCIVYVITKFTIFLKKRVNNEINGRFYSCTSLALCYDESVQVHCCLATNCNGAKANFSYSKTKLIQAILFSIEFRFFH